MSAVGIVVVSSVAMIDAAATSRATIVVAVMIVVMASVVITSAATMIVVISVVAMSAVGIVVVSSVVMIDAVATSSAMIDGLVSATTAVRMLRIRTIHRRMNTSRRTETNRRFRPVLAPMSSTVMRCVPLPPFPVLTETSLRVIS